jgi:hypothetical protein
MEAAITAVAGRNRALSCKELEELIWEIGVESAIQEIH